MKKILITAGPIGGKFDPNKVITNRCRGIPGLVFNIEGHGFIACLDENLEIYK